MRYLTWVFGFGFIILFSAIAAFLWGVYQGVIQSEFASATITSMLVLVTAVSVYMTLLLLIENRNARQREHEPVLIPIMRSVLYSEPELAIENIGNGPAQNVDVTVNIYPNNEKIAEIRRSNVRPGDRIHMFLREALQGEEVDEVELKGSCEDLFGREINIDVKNDIEVLRSALSDNQEP